MEPIDRYRTFVREEADAAQRRAPSAKRPLEVFQEWQARLAAGPDTRIDEVIDVERYTENCLGLTGWTTGWRVAFENFHKNLVQAFAEQTSEVEEVVEGEHTLVVRLRQTGKHVGEFLGVAPTGRRVAWDTVAIAHLREGRLVGQWIQMDLDGVRRQLTRASTWTCPCCE